MDLCVNERGAHKAGESGRAGDEKEVVECGSGDNEGNTKASEEG